MRPLLQLLAVIAGTVVAMASPSLAQPASLTAEQTEFFEARIRPVLVEHCYACHNAAEVAEGGLALDDRQGLLRGGEGGALIVAGEPDRSRLISILKHEIEGLEMPDDGPKLSDSIITDFERWIAMGAPDPRDTPPTTDELSGANSWENTLRRRVHWWSFQPIVDPKLPGSEGQPIDRFVRDRLNQHHLEPAPTAAPPTLIRRLYLTLIGLPPTAIELADWTQRYEQSDETSRVTESLIDHLLASDQFGERWARHWMDWIRYAESHGSEGDPAIDNAWLYRDYLIRALNDDVPYDQLLREHVAGDLLESPRINEQAGINESVIGTAHWRMVFHGFAPTDALDEKVRFIDDEINAFSKAFLGLTVSCARCHDHKFDAISQRDYYAMFGVLASCRPGRIAIDLPQRQNLNRQALAELKPRIRQAIAAAWMESLPSLPGKLRNQHEADADPNSQARIPRESPLHPLSMLQGRSGSEFREIWQRLAQSVGAGADAQHGPDQSTIIQRWKFSDPSAAKDWNLIGNGLQDQPTRPGAFAIEPEGNSAIKGIYPAGIYSHLLSDKHAARLTSPDVRLTTESEVWLKVRGDGEASTRYVVQDYPRNGTVYPVKQLKPQWSWHRFDLSYWSGDEVHFELTTSKDAPLLVQSPQRSWFGVTEVRLVPKGSAAPEAIPSFLASLVETAREHGDPASLEELESLYQVTIGKAVKAWESGVASDTQAECLSACLEQGLLTNALSELSAVAPLIEQYRRLEEAIEAPTRVPSLEETSGRTQPLFVRGNHHSPGEIIPRRFLEAIDTREYGYQESGRRQLAEDLLRDDNPLTRRVIANRIWHHLFGRGIVATPDNLGRMGQEPTHPELLDWLACRLVDDGWSLKSMIRRIVTSQTWQQSSRPSPAAMENDPANLYLSHANLRRLEAEAIRDSLLLASGSLDLTMHGPPVSGETNRRSIYVRVIRNSLDPFMRSFDFPEPFSAAGRRDVTNVPAQSLTLLNDPLVTRWASSLASSLIASDDNDDAASDQERIRQLFLTLVSRPPDEQETVKTLAFLQATRTAYEKTSERRELLTSELALAEREIAAIQQVVRARIESTESAPTESAPTGRIAPSPIACWDFDQGLADSIGGQDGTAHGQARVEAGMLILPPGSYVTTSAIKKTITEKTLEAWVRLEDLDQSGGGVISLQTADGSVFDSIVFGEMQPRHWLAGSDFHRRTKSFAGPVEQDAAERTVHLAIAYHADGKIVGYRDGVPYGQAYQSSPPIRFEKDRAILSFGLRHLPAGGNRLLRAKMERAALYDRALSATEIAASFEQAGGGVSSHQLLAAMSPEERDRMDNASEQRNRLRADLQSLGPLHEPRELAVWTELSRAMMLLKEMIYVP